MVENFTPKGSRQTMKSLKNARRQVLGSANKANEREIEIHVTARQSPRVTRHLSYCWLVTMERL